MMEMTIGMIAAVTVFIAAPGACVAALSVGTKYLSAQAKEWLALSHGTRLLIGVDDDSTETGYVFNMKPSVAKSDMLEVRMNGESNLVLNKFIPEDIKRIREHRKNGTLDQAHKKDIITEQVSQGFAKDQKRVLSVDVARKQLSQSPEDQWVDQYNENVLTTA